MKTKINKKSQRGATMIEYALLVSLIALAAYGAVQLLGTELSDLFTDIKNSL